MFRRRCLSRKTCGRFFGISNNPKPRVWFFQPGLFQRPCGAGVSAPHDQQPNWSMSGSHGIPHLHLRGCSQGSPLSAQRFTPSRPITHGRAAPRARSTFVPNPRVIAIFYSIPLIVRAGRLNLEGRAPYVCRKYSGTRPMRPSRRQLASRILRGYCSPAHRTALRSLRRTACIPDTLSVRRFQRMGWVRSAVPSQPSPRRKHYTSIAVFP